MVLWAIDKYANDHYNAVLATPSTLLLIVMSAAGPAIMQAAPIPEQAEECRKLGIEPEKCTEQNILGKRCFGMDCHLQPTEAKTDPLILSILVGCGAAFVAGILYVKRASREKSNQKPQ